MFCNFGFACSFGRGSFRIFSSFYVFTSRSRGIIASSWPPETLVPKQSSFWWQVNGNSRDSTVGSPARVLEGMLCPLAAQAHCSEHAGTPDCTWQSPAFFLDGGGGERTPPKVDLKQRSTFSSSFGVVDQGRKRTHLAPERMLPKRGRRGPGSLSSSRLLRLPPTPNLP